MLEGKNRKKEISCINFGDELFTANLTGETRVVIMSIGKLTAECNSNIKRQKCQCIYVCDDLKLDEEIRQKNEFSFWRGTEFDMGEN